MCTGISKFNGVYSWHRVICPWESVLIGTLWLCVGYKTDNCGMKNNIKILVIYKMVYIYSKVKRENVCCNWTTTGWSVLSRMYVYLYCKMYDHFSVWFPYYCKPLYFGVYNILCFNLPCQFQHVSIYIFTINIFYTWSDIHIQSNLVTYCNPTFIRVRFTFADFTID